MRGAALLCAVAAACSLASATFQHYGYGREAEPLKRDDAAERRKRNGWRSLPANEDTVRLVDVSRPEAAQWRTVVFEDDHEAWPALLVVVPPAPRNGPGRGIARVDVVDMYCPGDVFQLTATLQDHDLDAGASLWGRDSRALHRRNKRRLAGRPRGPAPVRDPEELLSTSTAVQSAQYDACDTWTASHDTALHARLLWSRGVLELPSGARSARTYLVRLTAVESPYGGGAASVRVRYGVFPEHKRQDRSAVEQPPSEHRDNL